MKELRTLLSINLCLILILNSICPAALATQIAADESELVVQETVVDEQAAGDEVQTLSEESEEETQEESDVVASGTCGANLTWSLDSYGLLTISGTGAMYSYSWQNDLWYSHRTEIKAVNITEGITTIGSYAFNGCNALKNITIPNSVTSIGASAFEYCSALTTVTIGSGIRTIGSSAFYGCTALTEVNINQYEILVTSYSNSFPTGTTVTYLTSDSPVAVYTWYVGVNDETDATATLYSDGKLVIGGTGCFAKGGWPTTITSVEIEDCITGMPNSAFSGCGALTTVAIGSGVTSIPSSAFENCRSLCDITFGSALTSVGAYAFNQCTSLQNADFGDSLASIGSRAFYGCTALSSVSFGDSLSRIYSYAFYGCSALTSIDLGANITVIEESTFSGSGLTEVVISDSITNVGSSAFKDCTALKSLTIGSGVKTIGTNAFSGCVSLTDVTWNASACNALGTNSKVFYGAGSCSEGITLTIGPAVESIPNYLFYVTANDTAGAVNLVSVKNESTRLTEIGSFAFYNCTALESVELADSVMTIGQSAFNSCSALIGITMPASLTTIGTKAFYNTALTEVTIGRQVTSVGDNAFAGCSEGFVIYGYAGSYIESYAGDNALNFTALESNILTLKGNYTGLAERQIDVGTDGLNLATLSQLYEQEMAALLPNTVLAGWNTAADGSGTAYTPDAYVTIAEGTTLFAQWEIPEITIGQTTFRIDQYFWSNKGWEYTWVSDLQRGNIILADYQDGGIISPVDLNVSVSGNVAIESTLGSALIGGQIYIELDNDAVLTISSSTDAPAVSCGIFTLAGEGSVTVSTGNAVGVMATERFKYNLDGNAMFTAAMTAVSSADIDIHNAANLYLSADSEAPADEYVGGAYLELRPKTWSLVLDANGGIWEDQEDTVKTIEAELQESIYLVDYSAQVSREGYNLSGWSETIDGAKTCGTAAAITSSGNLVLYAAWVDENQPAADIVASGTCGADLTWSLNSDGVLTVSGTGAMTNYDSGSMPWYNLRENIKDVVVSDGVTTIGECAFWSCWNLTSVRLADSLTTISYGAFTNCHLLETITIPNGVETIGDHAFASCNKLKNITIPDSVTTISGNAFNHCTSMTTATIGSGIRTIGGGAFYGCAALTAVEIDQYEILVTSYSNSFPTGATVTYLTSDSPVAVYTWYVGESFEEDVTATLYSDGKLVISGNGNFKTADWPTQKITSVEIEDGVTNIPGSAFFGCAALSTVKIGSGVMSIGWEAFYGCTALENVELGEGITYIYRLAFYGCASLKDIAFGNNLIEIAYAAFSGTGLVEIVIPDSVTCIREHAFKDCTSLKSLTVGSGLTYLGTEAFANCTVLTGITWNVPDLIYYTPAFGYMGGLNSNSNVFYAAGSAGEGITLTIGPDVKGIPNYLFYSSVNDTAGVAKVKAIVNKSAVLTEIGEFAFYNCAELESVDLGLALKTIGQGAFCNCAALTSVTLPASLSTIGAKAFYNTGLTEVTVGRQVTSIGTNAFAGCSDSFVVYGYAGSYVEAYAEDNALSFVALESYVLTLSENYGLGENGGFIERDYDVDANGLALSALSELFEQEMSNYLPGTRLVCWNTAADGTGTAYTTDAVVTIAEATTLYAQWEIPMVTINGIAFPADQDYSGNGWDYVWQSDNHRGYLFLNEYNGGGFDFPVDVEIYVTGDLVSEMSIVSTDGSALSGRTIEMFIEQSLKLTITSGTASPAINCEELSVHCYGSLVVKTEADTAIIATEYFECIINGTALIEAGNAAISSGEFRVYGPTDIYLSEDAQEPVLSYDGGPYLRMEAPLWSLELNANDGVWDEHADSTKCVRAYWWENIYLGAYSNQVSREGHVLTGWCDKDDNTEYSTTDFVASSANLVLYAVWAECALVVDGKTYSPDEAHNGSGWSYIPASEETPASLTLNNYTGGKISSTEDLAIVISGDVQITGAVGYPAIKTLGNLNLSVTQGTTVICGGAGEHGICANGDITLSIMDEASLYIRGGDGGAAIKTEAVLEIANNGNLTATGGSLSNALSVDIVSLLEGKGTSIFVSGSVNHSAVSEFTGYAWADTLKFYGGANASSARRCSVPWEALRYSYARIQPKTITVTLELNGGTTESSVELTQEYAQEADNSVVLSIETEPVLFGYSFVGWTDSAGNVYESGESYTFDDSKDEITLYAQWKELEYDVVIDDEGEELILYLKDETVTADATVLLAVYSEEGQMQDVFTGTYESDGYWHFRTTVPQGNDMIKIFFLGTDCAPLREEVDPNT